MRMWKANGPRRPRRLCARVSVRVHIHISCFKVINIISDGGIFFLLFFFFFSIIIKHWNITNAHEPRSTRVCDGRSGLRGLRRREKGGLKFILNVVAVNFKSRCFFSLEKYSKKYNESKINLTTSCSVKRVTFLRTPNSMDRDFRSNNIM